jgi:hypothetical protein
LIAGTSYARLLPLANRLIHTPSHPPFSVEQLRKAVTEVLTGIKLVSSPPRLGDVVELGPMSNTWSRAARRQAVRDSAVPGTPTPVENVSSSHDPLFRAQISIISPLPPARPEVEEQSEQMGASLAFDWTWGRDRGIVDGFWKYLLTKAGLLGSQDTHLNEQQGRGTRGVRRGRDVAGWSGRGQ